MSFKLDKDFWRRFKFYGFGLLLGILLVNVITKGKACQMPATVKLQELRYQHIEYTQHAQCRMQCRGIDSTEVLYVLTNGSINYGKSEVRAKPCGKYAVEGETTDKQFVRIIVGDCDTTSRIITVIDLRLNKDTCDCP